MHAGIVAGFESSSTSILESEGSGTVCVVSRFSQSHSSSQFTLIAESRPGTAGTVYTILSSKIVNDRYVIGSLFTSIAGVCRVNLSL